MDFYLLQMDAPEFIILCAAVVPCNTSRAVFCRGVNILLTAVSLMGPHPYPNEVDVGVAPVGVSSIRMELSQVIEAFCG